MSTVFRKKYKKYAFEKTEKKCWHLNAVVVLYALSAAGQQSNLICRNGGIGRRARFRSVWLLQSWGFKSLFLHHWNQQRISADFFVVKRKIGILTIYLFCVNNGIFLFISTIVLWIHVIIFPIFVSSCLLCFISTIIFWAHVMNKMYYTDTNLQYLGKILLYFFTLK